ncbi:MAG: HAD family hydrolase [Nanoarchaeota archaeon]
MIDTVIFDMDGVIINSVEIHFNIWREVAKKFNAEISDDFINKTNGMNTPEIAAFLVKEFNLDAKAQDISAEKRKLSGEKLKEGIPLFDGVQETISTLKKLGYKIGLATMTPKNHVEYALGKNLFELEFDAVVTDDDVKRPKPEPDVFLKCAEELQSPPEKCVVIEDALNGVTAARKAGMYAIAVTTTTSREHFVNAHAIIQKTSELNNDLVMALTTKVEEKNG